MALAGAVSTGHLTNSDRHMYRTIKWFFSRILWALIFNFMATVDHVMCELFITVRTTNAVHVAVHIESID